MTVFFFKRDASSVWSHVAGVFRWKGRRVSDHGPSGDQLIYTDLRAVDEVISYPGEPGEIAHCQHGIRARWSESVASLGDLGLANFSGKGSWRLESDGVIDARAFGMKADGVVLTDVVTSSGSAQISSATASFTEADVGKKVLLNNWSGALTGTIAYSSGSGAVTGTGTAFDTEIPLIFSNRPGQGGMIGLSNGKVLSVATINSATSLTVYNLYPSGASGLTGYKYVQSAGTIVSVQSPTQCTLSFPAEINQTARTLFYFTDDTAALQTAVSEAIASSAKVVQLPLGYIGITENSKWSGARNITVRGHGPGTVIKDGRLSWTRYNVPAEVLPKAILEFVGVPTDVTVSDLAIDGSVPYFGIFRPPGTALGNSGGRQGSLFTDPVRCVWRNVHLAGLGVGNEALIAESVYTGTSMTWDGCTGLNQDNFINPNSGNMFARVVNCDVTSGYQALLISHGSVTACTFRAHVDTADYVVRGNAPVTLDSAGDVSLSDVNIYGGDTRGYAVGILEAFTPFTGVTGKTLVIENVRIHGNANAALHNADTGAFKLLNNGGYTRINGLSFRNISTSTTGGRHMFIKGDVRGLYVSNVSMASGSANMTVGVETSGVAAGGATIDFSSFAFDSNVTSRYVLGAGLAARKAIVSVTTTGNVAVGTQTEDVTGAGGITRTLYSPSLTPGVRVTIVNGSAGSVTMAGSIVGSTSVPTGTCAIFESTGTAWGRV